MRHAVAFLVTLMFAACNTAPVSHSQSQAVSPGPVPAAAGQKSSTDSAIEFLLTAAATDFNVHSSPIPVRFRDVRLGHLVTPTGARQYLLCGEFLPQQREGRAEWIPFSTIKTSGYEQYVGAQAVSFCQRRQVMWDKDEDLSSLLQNRLDSLR